MDNLKDVFVQSRSNWAVGENERSVLTPLTEKGFFSSFLRQLAAVIFVWMKCWKMCKRCHCLN